MTNRITPVSGPQTDFATDLAGAMARSLFNTVWDGIVKLSRAPADPDDEDFVANLPDDMIQSAAKRSWEQPETPLADTMTEAEIAALISAGDDPWAQSSSGQGRALLKGDPPPSLIAAALTLAQLVGSEEHLQDLFCPGNVTNFVCPTGSFLWALAQILPNVIEHWKGYMTAKGTADLHWYVQDGDDGSVLKSRERRRGLQDARIERSLAQGASVLMVTLGSSHPSDAMSALVTRTVAWTGITPEIVIETMRLTHSTTGQLATAELRARLPDAGILNAFSPAQIDAAFAAPTTLLVADRLAAIAEKLMLQMPELTLDAVHGLREVRLSLDRMLNDLRLWRDGALSWSEVASSAVFHGPPGTGKTTLAKAFAGSAGIPIIETSYSDCQKQGHQGDMLAALDRAFAQAKNAAPAVLFIDELDSFSQRDARRSNTDYMRGVVNGLLEQINRAKDTGGLIVLGATNHLEIVDPAVIRSGRFDLKLHVPYPDKRGLEAILAAKLGRERAGELRLAAIADRLLGQSGAVAEAVVRDAKGRARADRTPVQQHHLDSATGQVVPRLDDEMLRRAAIHEAGHVVVMVRLGWPFPKRVCLTTQGGQVEYFPFGMLTPKTARERLQVLLAGRDAATAKETWRVPEEVRIRVERHLLEAEKKALSLVAAYKAHVMSLADRLMRVRDLDGPDIERFMQRADAGEPAMALAKAGSSVHGANLPG